jgi:ABC-type transport system substrate-binding protein
MSTNSTKIFLSTFFAGLVFATSSQAANVNLNPNAKAPQGGTFYYNIEAEPESLHPIMSTDQYEQYVAEWAHEPLCGVDYNTYGFTPRLAERWEVSKDGLTYTFYLRKNAFFHNGDPVTADEVKFSFDAIREPKHQALNILPYVEGFSKIEVVDPHTIKFTAKEKYFKNLEVLCGSYVKIIPKSAYGNIEKSVKMQKELIGAGPFKVERYDKGQALILKRFDKWYGKDIPELKGYYNFDTISFRITKDDNIIVERFRKGELDFHTAKGVDTYLKAEKGVGARAKAYKVVNDMPKSYGYIGFNFRHPILAELPTREALAMLVNRREMNKKFRNNMSDLATGPVPVKSKQAADVKPFEFNPKKAQELLKKAGWSDSDKDGVLDRTKDGKKEELKFTMIYANKDSEKYWTMFKEDAKKYGVELTLKFLEWNSFLKTVEDNNMELYAMSWGGGSVEMDPKQIWHSSSSAKGGSNRGAYSNPEVDKLIDEGRAELDDAKRTAIFKKAYTMIAKDVPYIFLFNNKYEFYIASNRVKKPGDTWKYAIGYDTWWVDQK